MEAIHQQLESLTELRALSIVRLMNDNKINKSQILVCTIVAMIGSAYAPPPDLISKMLAVIPAGIVCLVLLFIIMSRDAVKEAKSSVRTLIAWQITLCVIVVANYLWHYAEFQATLDRQ